MAVSATSALLRGGARPARHVAVLLLLGVVAGPRRAMGGAAMDMGASDKDGRRPPTRFMTDTTSDGDEVDLGRGRPEPPEVPGCSTHLSDVEQQDGNQDLDMDRVERFGDRVEGQFTETDGCQFGWSGSVTANGKIYGIPSGATQIIRMDPHTEELDYFGNFPSGQGKWSGGVFVPSNGCIYGIPFYHSRVLKINTVTGEATEFEQSLDNQGMGWSFGVLANGRVYGIPFMADEVLEIDPSTDTTSLFGGDAIRARYSSGETEGARLPKWSGGAATSSGVIYAAPYGANEVLRIHADRREVDFLQPLETVSNVKHKFSGGVLAPNGRIYFAPVKAGCVLVVDPQTGASHTFGNATGISSFQPVLAPNGHIYAVPFKAHSILKIDPSTETVHPFGCVAGGWMGAALADNGHMYGAPCFSAAMLRIQPSLAVPSDVEEEEASWLSWPWLLAAGALASVLFGGLAAIRQVKAKRAARSAGSGGGGAHRASAGVEMMPEARL